MKVVIIGGTGLIGSRIANLLTQNGHSVLAAAPSTGVDILTGDGLPEAMVGAEVVIDVSNSPSFEAEAAMSFFKTAAANIAAAEKKAGVRHHVALSVVGTEKLQESGYFQAKLKQEVLIRSSGVPFTIVRATQFFEFIRGIAQSATADGVVRLAPANIRPMAADDVASAVTQIALGEPQNEAVEITGPTTYALPDLVQKVLSFDQDARRVEAAPDTLYFGARLDADTLLPIGQNPRVGAIELDRWLATTPAPK